MHDSLLSWKSHRIALYNEIRPQFDFLNRVDIFYQIIVIYKKLNCFCCLLFTCMLHVILHSQCRPPYIIHGIMLNMFPFLTLLNKRDLSILKHQENVMCLKCAQKDLLIIYVLIQIKYTLFF